MGIYFTDPFSLLHFATGIIVFFWGISFFHWFWIHFIYEVFTNTKIGIWFINDVVQIFPGGKLNYDTLINSVGDQFYGLLGWIFAYCIVKLYGNEDVKNEYL